MTMAAETTTTASPDDRLALATKDLDKDSAIAVRASFGSLLTQAEDWGRRARALVVTDEADVAGMKLARESRLALRQIRIAAERARKSMKEDALKRGQAIDGAYKVIASLIEPLEEHLLEQETFAERAEKRRREERAAERAQTLRALEVDPAMYADLGAMPAEAWEGVRGNAERAKAAREEARRREEEARVEAERQAAARREQERLEAEQRERERAEREREQAAENARLRAEAEAREAAAKAERERLKAEADARAAEERKAREKAEAEARRQRQAAEKARLEAEAARAQAELERREREEAEARRVAEEQAAREAAELAPDRAKFEALAEALRAVALPTCTTKRGQAAATKVADQMAKMIAWVAKTGAAL